MTHQLNLTSLELLTVVEALYHEITNRLLWAAESGHWFRQRPFATAQTVVNSFVSAYQIALLLVREIDGELADGFIEEFTLTDLEWDILDAFTKASSWEDIPAP